MAIQTGSVIDRYRIIERIGKGGMAIVYKAVDTRLERDVAIKLIRFENIAEDFHQKALKRFEQEAKAQAMFQHPNIAPIFDYGEYEGSPYLVMAYISGGTLKKRFSGNQIPFEKAAKILAPIANALDYAHSRDILHRDIKPANILLTKNNTPMLTDFGIAKFLDSADETKLTSTGFGIGTPEYMAPEQWKGNTTAQSDIYGLGVVFFELVTGIKPFTADTPAAVAILQATEPIPKPNKQVVGLPFKVEKVIYKALSLDLKNRFQSAKEFESVLNDLSLLKTQKLKPIRKKTKKELVEQELDKTVDDLHIKNSLNSNVQKQKKRMRLWLSLVLFFAIPFFFIISQNFYERLLISTTEPEEISSPVPFTPINSSPTSLVSSIPAEIISLPILKNIKVSGVYYLNSSTIGIIFNIPDLPYSLHGLANGNLFDCTYNELDRDLISCLGEKTDESVIDFSLILNDYDYVLFETQIEIPYFESTECGVENISGTWSGLHPFGGIITLTLVQDGCSISGNSSGDITSSYYYEIFGGVEMGIISFYEPRPSCPFLFLLTNYNSILSGTYSRCDGDGISVFRRK